MPYIVILEENYPSVRIFLVSKTFSSWQEAVAWRKLELCSFKREKRDVTGEILLKDPETGEFRLKHTKNSLRSKAGRKPAGWSPTSEKGEEEENNTFGKFAFQLGQKYRGKFGSQAITKVNPYDYNSWKYKSFNAGWKAGEKGEEG